MPRPTDVDMTTVPRVRRLSRGRQQRLLLRDHRCGLRRACATSLASTPALEHAALAMSSRLAARPHSYRRGSDGGAAT